MRPPWIPIVIAGVLLSTQVAHADEPPTTRVAPSIRPTLGWLALGGGGLATACVVGAVITNTSDDRDTARGFIAVGILSGSIGLTSLAHYIWVADAITEDATRDRVQLTRIAGTSMAVVGLGLVLTGTKLVEDASDNVRDSLTYTGAGVMGVGVALLVHSIAYRGAAASSVVVTPTGRGFALSGTF